jgi:uncharacterized protein YjbJ (UPF0337 family)
VVQAIVNRQYRESSMNKDQVKGRFKESKGKVKELAGRIVGNKGLEQQGIDENAAGKAQADSGDVREGAKKPDKHE